MEPPEAVEVYQMPSRSTIQGLSFVKPAKFIVAPRQQEIPTAPSFLPSEEQ